MLKVTAPGTLTRNIDISTHRGSRLEIMANRAVVMDITNDNMSDNDILNWYKSRYSGFGLGIKIMDDSVVKAAPVKVTKTDEVKVEPEKPDTVKAGETVSVQVVEPVKVEFNGEAVPEINPPVEKAEEPVKEVSDSYLTDMLFSNVVPTVQTENSEVSASKVESKVTTGTRVDTMTYFEMVQFAKDNDIVVPGREKELYIKTLAEWFREHPGS
jgi:hypothetical protein